MPKLELPGVNVIQDFTTAGDAEGKEQSFSGYIDYMNRKDAQESKDKDLIKYGEIRYQDYNNYMGNPEKTSGLFTATKDKLSADDIDELKQNFDQAQENESILWKTVISFDNEWLKENGVYEEENNYINTDILMDATRNCMRTMLEKEGLDKSAVWSAAIHYNTDNIHIHVGTVEPVPLRERKRLCKIEFDKKWLEEQGVITDELRENYYMNGEERLENRAVQDMLRNRLIKAVSKETGEPLKLGAWLKWYPNGNGNIRVTYNGEQGKEPSMAKIVYDKDEYKGEFSIKSLRMGRARVGNTIMGRQPETELLNNLIRNQIVQGIREDRDKLYRNEEIKNMFIDLYNKMPNDKRQWQYASNTFGANNRARLDNLSKKILSRYFGKELDEINKLLDKQGDKYRRAYGGGEKTKNKFIQNKKNDMYKRVGNAILKEMKQFDKMVRGNNGDKPVLTRKHPTRNPRRNKRGRAHPGQNERELELSLRMIERSLRKTLENYKNLQVYQQIQTQIEVEQE